MEIKLLLRVANSFQTKTSGVREDMSQRIMYSILPHVAEPGQTALTGGVVDYKALKHAVEGRHDIIRYGAQAAVEELEHSPNNLWTLAVVKLDAGKLEEAMDIAIQSFDTSFWNVGFGGKLWGQIARSVRQLIRLDRSLNQLRQKSNKSPKDIDKEVQIMTDIIVEMNIFDGLSHNSDSVMRNMVELEHQRYSKPGNYQPEYLNIKRIMDSKELDSPMEVFRMIQPTLEGSGDIHKFKDHVSKLRRSDEYRQHDPKLMEKLFYIFMRKVLLKTRGWFNQAGDKLRHSITQLETDWHDPTQAGFTEPQYDAITNEFQTSIAEIRFTLGEFRMYVARFLAQYPEFAGKEKELQALMRRQGISSNKLLQQMETSFNDMAPFEPIEKDERAVTISQCKQLLTKLNGFTYILDDI